MFPRGTHKAYLPTEQLTSLTNPCVGNVGHIRGVNKIMETLRNSGIEFVLATLKELQLATMNVLLPFFLHSVVLV
jgi:hypothetical protein